MTPPTEKSEWEDRLQDAEKYLSETMKGLDAVRKTLEVVMESQKQTTANLEILRETVFSLAETVRQHVNSPHGMRSESVATSADD